MGVAFWVGCQFDLSIALRQLHSISSSNGKVGHGLGYVVESVCMETHLLLRDIKIALFFVGLVFCKPKI
jgi:hypothetical protein